MMCGPDTRTLTVDASYMTRRGTTKLLPRLKIGMTIPWDPQMADHIAWLDVDRIRPGRFATEIWGSGSSGRRADGTPFYEWSFDGAVFVVRARGCKDSGFEAEWQNKTSGSAVFAR